MPICLPSYPLHSRIAPTPSGFLHLGNGLNFVLTWLLVRASQGTLWLRIDDIDRQRTRDIYLEDIFCQLDFLGLDYDFGPMSVDDIPQYAQSNFVPICQSVLGLLTQSGLVYECGKSRAGADNPFGTIQNLRIRTDNQANICIVDLANPTPICGDIHALMPNFVIWNKHGLPAYQLACLVQDTHSNINFIVRGQDLWPSSLAQAYLARQAGLTNYEQTVFWHHSLLTNENQEKLSKSAGAYSIKQWRSQAGKASQIYACIASYLGLKPRLDYTLTDLVECIQTKSNLDSKPFWKKKYLEIK